MGAWLNVRDGDVSNVLRQLDSLAGAITSDVNTLHNGGYGLDGSTGNNFFRALAPSGTGAITNLGNATISGKMLNPVNVDTDHYQLAYDGTNWTVSNIDKGGAVAIDSTGGSMTKVPLAAANSFFAERGYSIALTGNPIAGDTFNVSAVNNAAVNMALTPAITNDINKIAAGATTQQGDGAVAQQISALQGEKMMGGEWAPSGTTGLHSYTDFYASLVGVVGTASKVATDNVTLYQSVSSQVASMKSQISGVNMDEEMVNLIKFQNAYQASAKTITTVDQMLQTLMGIIR